MNKEETLSPKEIIDSMCDIMPYQLIGRTSIEPYLIEAFELYGKQQWNEAIKLAVKEVKTKEAGFHDGGFDNYEFIVDSQSILKLLK